MKEWRKVLDTVAENQKIAMILDNSYYDTSDSYTKGMISSTFATQAMPGVIFTKSASGLFCFGLLNAYYKSREIKLVPILHLTPKFLDIANRISENKSDFALLFPNEAPTIHGSKEKTIFSQMHDALHTRARLRCRHLQPDMMNVVKGLLKERAKLQQSYKQKLALDIEFTTPRFNSMPTKDEFVAYIVDRVIVELIDGSYFIRGQGMSQVHETIEKLTNDLIVKEIYVLPKPVNF